MHASPIALLLGVAGLFATSGAFGETLRARTATLPFDQCLEIINEVSAEFDAKPFGLVNTENERTVRFKADDGYVTVSCNRADNKIVLSTGSISAQAGLQPAQDRAKDPR
ncbi:hypothetical protein [Microvirga massiliensis]|uniref:hypothetical protein n=1 Tax=Microvirga massiliensis TaxID=1033741 RepID=UPI00062B733A|nr:hypothetical protein [Microvirga massiliensis]